jgi:hypothetical protein
MDMGGEKCEITWAIKTGLYDLEGSLEMADPKQKSWILVPCVVGVNYALIGIVFATPSGHALPNR